MVKRKMKLKIKIKQNFVTSKFVSYVSVNEILCLVFVANISSSPKQFITVRNTFISLQMSI